MRMKGIACVANLDEEALRKLLDVFGTQYSLEDIASAYYEAKGSVNIAGDILCARHDGRILIARADAFENKSVGTSTTSVELSSGWESENAASLEYTSANPNAGAFKSKKGSASMGSVTGVIGRNYVKPRPSRNDSSETMKPVKIDSKELPVSIVWREEDPSNRTTRNGSTNGDLEEFLYEMLGDGFQLDKSVIQEVFDCCGFDVDKSMDKLLDLSASTLEKSDDVIGIAAEKFTGICPDDQFFLIQDKPQSKDFAQRKGYPKFFLMGHTILLCIPCSKEATSMIRNPKRSSRRNKDRVTMEKEVLEALFTVPERSEEVPKRNGAVRVVGRSRAFGKLVTEPLKDTDTGPTTIVKLLNVSKDVEDGLDDDENSYDVLRQAVKEHWITMKEYFKAALEAFAKGDKARAAKLVELGHFFNKKAREADERSAEKMLETRDDEIISLDLRNFEPKEALSLLRVHLTSVSGIPSIKGLRIIVGTIEEDTKKGARRQLIMKQLEKESIKWNEEENGRIISIRVDVINPKLLSFAKKKNETNMGSS
ncbi:putative nuclear RNA export factor SDE5 isoform X2 [Durio zibethinus]|nr:putative nuclear RNA export factor SDE5 isoform X2 [Durio zibethinus]XP_022717091.1 putative nuclear RNA export factor SDE5 isoform X2 [Durio zibethinus]XP_022717095.1 putative nuclear RNA export factor SDE5 isoform X2 [Durio zibethinus]